MSDVQSTLAERGSRYGDFADNARVSRKIQAELQSHPGWYRLDDTKQEGLTMIAQKIARILNGDPNYRDNWHDIAGYAVLVEDRCAAAPALLNPFPNGPPPPCARPEVVNG